MARKIALVTGGNKGIGFEIVKGLRERNWLVVLAARDRSRGQAALDKLGGASADLVFLPVDVSDDASVAAAAADFAGQFDHLDALVNNAGIARDVAPPSTLPLALVKEVFETNVFGPIRTIQAFLPFLRRASAARIVNVSSGLGSLTLTSDPSTPLSKRLLLAYAPSKSALNAITVQFANELRDTAIRVVAADPGYTATDLNGFAGTQTVQQGAERVLKVICDESLETGGVYDGTGRMAW